MHNEDFDELAGRIQALTDFVLHLTADLEINQIINGSRLTQGLHKFADGRQFDGRHLQATQRTLHELAQFLDDARSRRQ
jgi:hypothetical protein